MTFASRSSFLLLSTLGVGGVVALALSRELAPVLAAVVVTARAGSTSPSTPTTAANQRPNQCRGWGSRDGCLSFVSSKAEVLSPHTPTILSYSVLRQGP